MVYPDTFSGFCTDRPETWNTFTKQDIVPKPFADTDVDVKIECCGVCGSDLHTITGGWGSYEGPMCVGHEIIGEVVKVGKDVKTVKVGDRVGVGAQVWSCMECAQCLEGNENYCSQKLDTYNARYPDGSVAHGGFASHIRAHWYYVFAIPPSLPSDSAAPLLCAGITTFAPLVRAGIGPGSIVGVSGIGGLGHLGIQWASALGATVYAFTHSSHKLDDARALGAKDVILTGSTGWALPWAFKFDFILNCADVTPEFDLPTYISTLKVGGQFHMCGLPDQDLPPLPSFLFTDNAAKLTGSHIGNRTEMEAMLKLAAEKGVLPWVEKMEVSEKACQTAMERMKTKGPKYRFTLTGFNDAFT